MRVMQKVPQSVSRGHAVPSLVRRVCCTLQCKPAERQADGFTTRLTLQVAHTYFSMASASVPSLSFSIYAIAYRQRAGTGYGTNASRGWQQKVIFSFVVLDHS